MKRLLLLVVLLLLATAGATQAAQRAVTIPGVYFDPQRLVVLVGDTVTWTNADSQTHTVTSDDDVFDSGYLDPGHLFSQTFTTQGTYTYVCLIHSFMHGEVDVFSIELSAPKEAVRPGELVTLSGAVPAGTTEVTIEAEDEGGAFAPIGTATAAPDGSFTFAVFPTLPTKYRAVAGELESSTVLVSVSARIELRFASRTDEGTWLLALTTPLQPRAPARLERYVRELFTWVPYRHLRLDSHGQARILVAPRHATRIRIVLVQGVHGYGPAVSAPVRVRSSDRA